MRKLLLPVGRGSAIDAIGRILYWENLDWRADGDVLYVDIVFRLPAQRCDMRLEVSGSDSSSKVQMFAVSGNPEFGSMVQDSLVEAINGSIAHEIKRREQMLRRRKKGPKRPFRRLQAGGC